MAVMGQNESKAPVVSAKELDREFLPRHVAIIMDGNGRWAQKRGMPRTFGHKAGVEALREIIKYSDELGIEALTIYAFSAENWKRSAEEVGALMRLLLQYFTSEIDELNEKNVRIRILGDIDGMPKGLEKQQNALHAAIRRTLSSDGIRFFVPSRIAPPPSCDECRISPDHLHICPIFGQSIHGANARNYPKTGVSPEAFSLHDRATAW